MNSLPKTFLLCCVGVLVAVSKAQEVSKNQANTSLPLQQGPILIRIAVFVVDIDDIDGAAQNFTANVYFELNWTDSRLTHEGKNEIILPLKEIWNPRLQIVNQQKVWPTFPEIVEVFPDGKVVYRQRVWGQFSQPLNLKDFPFDQQVFNIQFVAVGHEPGEILLISDPESQSGIAKQLSLADWKITTWKVENKPYEPIPGEDKDEGYLFSFNAQRETGYFVTKMIIPLVLIVIMSWVVFWIDPKDSGTQIGVAVTSMLTLIAYRFATDALLPKISYVTRLDYFILSSTILVFTSLIEVVITSALARYDRLRYARLIDKWARLIMPLVFLLLSTKAFFF